MPDFSVESCHNYWSKHSDPMIYKALCFMESVEEWISDDHETIDEEFNALGGLLNNIDNIDLKHADEFIAIAANVRATRKLMLLQTLNEAYPGAVAKLIKQAEVKASTSKDHKLFLQRHVVFERLRLLGKIFSPEASQKIKDIIEN